MRGNAELGDAPGGWRRGRFSEEATPLKAVFQVEAVDYTSEEYRLWSQSDL